MTGNKRFVRGHIGNTKIAHLSLKGIGRFIFHKVRSYDKFKPYFTRVSFDAKYKNMRWCVND